MSERLAKQIRNILSEQAINEEVAERYIGRLEEGSLIRDENPESHFCAYFAAYDPQREMVFIGHHIKSGLWLFNGGHLDEGETAEEAVAREMEEEWGENVYIGEVTVPSLLTITEIEQENITCRRHFDVWYLVPVSSESFNPDESRLANEFYETGWKTFDEARGLIEDPNTLLAIDEIKKLAAD